MKMVLSSDNVHKLREYREILAGSDIDILSKTAAGCTLEVEETGATFAENAFLKADALCRATGLAAIADDSGLCVDALGGAPGIYSARFTGSHDDSDAAKRAFLLAKLQGVTERTGRFVCAICCVLPNGGVLRAEGTCEGSVLAAERGSHGFGYDAVFQPAGYEISMAEMTNEEKNAISHRGNALKAFKAEWEKYNDQQ